MKRSEGTEKVPFLTKYPRYRACRRGKFANFGLFQCPQAKRLGVKAKKAITQTQPR